MTQRQVSLPVGKPVMISDDPQEWWMVDGSFGYLDPRLLAPDPDQPRKHMNPTELEEFEQSIKERGVRESITITPRALAPWARVSNEHEHLPFIIVSGHRRSRSAMQVLLLAVPVIVRVYESEEDHRLDGWVLNKGRADLTPIEEGWEIVRLLRTGISLAKIAKSSGTSPGYVENRRNLTQLHPAIQKLIDPAVPTEKRLPLTIAGELGGVLIPTQEEIEALHITFDDEIALQQDPYLLPRSDVWSLGDNLLRFELQKILLAVILARSLNAIRAKDLILEHALQLESAGKRTTKADRFQPRKRKQIIQNLADTIMGSKIVDWTPANYEEIFESASAEEVKKFRLSLGQATTMLSDIGTLLQRIEEKKRTSSAEVVKLPRRG